MAFTLNPCRRKLHPAGALVPALQVGNKGQGHSHLLPTPRPSSKIPSQSQQIRRARLRHREGPSALLSLALEKPPCRGELQGARQPEGLKGGSASASRFGFHTQEIFPKVQAKLGADKCLPGNLERFLKCELFQRVGNQHIYLLCGTERSSSPKAVMNLQALAQKVG